MYANVLIAHWFRLFSMLSPLLTFVFGYSCVIGLFYDHVWSMYMHSTYGFWWSMSSLFPYITRCMCDMLFSLIYKRACCLADSANQISVHMYMRSIQEFLFPCLMLCYINNRMHCPLVSMDTPALWLKPYACITDTPCLPFTSLVNEASVSSMPTTLLMCNFLHQ